MLNKAQSICYLWKGQRKAPSEPFSSWTLSKHTLPRNREWFSSSDCFSTNRNVQFSKTVD